MSINVSKEEIWNKVKGLLPVIAPSARIEVYWDQEHESLWTAILQGQSFVEAQEEDILLFTFDSLDRFWTEYPYKLEDLVQDPKERKRLKKSIKAFEEFLLNIYEEEFLTKVDVPALG